MNKCPTCGQDFERKQIRLGCTVIYTKYMPKPIVGAKVVFDENAIEWAQGEWEVAEIGEPSENGDRIASLRRPIIYKP